MKLPLVKAGKIPWAPENVFPQQHGNSMVKEPYIYIIYIYTHPIFTVYLHTFMEENVGTYINNISLP